MGNFLLVLLNVMYFSFRTALQKLRAIQVKFPRRQTMKNVHIVILFKSFHTPSALNASFVFEQNYNDVIVS